MIFRKKYGDGDSHQEKKYEFIREQIRPQRKKQIRIFIYKLVMVMVFAGLFGVIAGSIIVSMQKGDKEVENDTVPMNMYSATPESTIGKSENTNATEDSNNSGRPKINLRSLNRMSERLAAIGEDAGSFLVGVKRKDSTSEWLEKDGVSNQEFAFGMLVKETGSRFYLITTCDILNSQPSVEVQLKHDILVEGKIHGSDPQLNLSVVSIKKSDIDAVTLERMKIAQIGNSSSLKKGTNVVAIGCPNGILNSVVSGNITNDTIVAPITDGEIDLFTTTMPYSNTGNGVILDLDSKVVGLITTEFTNKTGTAGLSFIDMGGISGLLEHLMGKENVPYIGCEGQSISPATAKTHNLEAGAYITDVYSDSPAYECGMRVADIVTVMDGREIDSMSEIYDILLQHKSGDTIKCTVMRGAGKKKVKKELKIKLG